MSKTARPHRTKNASEQNTPLTPGRSALPTIAFSQKALRSKRKQCGRCGMDTKKSEFCSACRKFFLLVNGPKSIFAAHF